MNGGGTLADTFVHASVPWQRHLADAVRDVDELWRLLDLPVEDLPAAREAAKHFPLMVPRSYLRRITPGNRQDPLLVQVLPLAAELEDVPGFTADPLAEGGCSPVPGLLHKYQGRALLVSTAACAIHCRYCFRRHYPYQDVPRRGPWWEPAMAYLRAHPEVDELLLSGGDPLTLPDAILEGILTDAEAIPTLRRLRFHTRIPVVLPERIDAGFIRLLTSRRLPVVMVLHVNHPQEMDARVTEVCARLRGAGVTLLNQSVLLKGINDEVGILADLSRSLFDAGVLPYYLHVLDRVAGAAHFLRDDTDALRLHGELAARLPGYLVPRLVREEPGAPGKTPLTD